MKFLGNSESQVANTETWNGSSWTATPNINTARGYVGHAGTSTASIIFAGRAPGPSTSNAGESQVANTETWNGSSWTETTEFNTGRARLGGAGINTATLIYGGNKNPNTLAGETEFLGNSESQVANTETWDGSSWTESGDLNQVRALAAGAGTITDGLLSAGSNNGSTTYANVETQVANTETWNGSSWTATTSLNTGRTQGGAFGSTSTNGIVAAGYIGTGYGANCESFDGSSWTEVNDMNTARNGFAGNGIQTSALGYSQDDPARSGKTESSSKY